jgi:NodT family efflux transporter outer membrane factor (OMF) lipoprotein
LTEIHRAETCSVHYRLLFSRRPVAWERILHLGVRLMHADDMTSSRHSLQPDGEAPIADSVARFRRFVAERGRRAQRALVTVPLLLLAACATLQESAGPLPPDPIPAAWTAGAADAQPGDLSAWWTQFGDPVLPKLVERALLFNTNVTAAQARLRQARALRLLAEANLAPSVTGGGSAQSSRVEGREASEQYRVSLDAAWELDLWGGGAAGLRAAEAGVRASALTLAQVRVSVAAEVALTLLQLRGTQARKAIAQRNLASQFQTLRITQWRQEAGLVTQLDVEQARTAVEQVRAQLPLLAGSSAQAMNALAVLTGRAPGALHAKLAPSWGDAVELPAAPTDLALAIPAEVLRQRADVLAAEQQLIAATERVEQADAERLPSLQLGGSIGLNALSLGALGSGAGVASLLASVSVPIFDAGRLQAQVRQQEAARDDAAAGYRAAVLAALQEVEDALVALNTTREQLSAQQAAATSARTAATLAELRYRSGLVDFQNVLQTQRTLLLAEDSLAGATTTLATDHVRLYKALGGGWTPNPEENSTR